MSGFTKSYRAKWQNPIFRNLNEAGIWSWICDSAVWQDCVVGFSGRAIPLKRGQLATSRRFISEGFLVGEQVTRTFLENLEKVGMINLQSTNWGTIITVCNYDLYQGSSISDNQQNDVEQTNAQQTTNPNKKESKNKRNKEIKNKEFIDIGNIPVEVWEAFLAMRVKIKKPATEYAQKQIISKLKKLSAEGHDPVEILNNSIVNSWQDVFPPKNQQNRGYKNEQLFDDNTAAMLSGFHKAGLKAD